MYLVAAPAPRLAAIAPEKLWKLGPAPESGDPGLVLREAEAELARCARATAAGNETMRRNAEYLETWLAWRRGAPRRVPEPPSSVHHPYRVERPSHHECVARCYALADAGASHADFLRDGVAPGVSIFHVGRYLHQYADFSIYPRVYGLREFAVVAHYIYETVEVDVEGDRLYILNDGPRPLAATMRSELGPYILIIAAKGPRPDILQAIAPLVETVQPWLATLILSVDLERSGGCRDIVDFFASRLPPGEFAAVAWQAVEGALASPRMYFLPDDALVFELARRCGPAAERAVAAWSVAPPPRDQRRTLD
jgi:hypothetical protein